MCSKGWTRRVHQELDEAQHRLRERLAELDRGARLLLGDDGEPEPERDREDDDREQRGDHRVGLPHGRQDGLEVVVGCPEDEVIELRAVLAVHRREHVLRAHSAADGHMSSLMTQARCIRSQFARALQIHRLGVEHAHKAHQLVQLHQGLWVLGERRYILTHELALGVEILHVLDIEMRCLRHKPSRERALDSRLIGAAASRAAGGRDPPR